MPVTVRLKKGLDIKLKGAPARNIAGAISSAFYGIRPVDFTGLTPKMVVKPGDSVKAGTPLFLNKVRPEVLFTSPVSGIVKEVRRGEQRKLLEVVVERSGDDYVDFGKSDPLKSDRQEIIQKLLSSGLWPSVRQRPYHIIANPADKPKSLFISGFDTAPLAPDLNFIMENVSAELFHTGLKAIGKLTDGKVHLVLDGKVEPAALLKNAPGVEISYFKGPHPAGNTGIHIHHLDPVNKGEVVWYVNIQDLLAIGRLFSEGIYRPEKIIALAGSEVINPQYYKVLSGVAVKDLTTGNVADGNLRFISGNVLTGTKISADGYLGYYDNMVTIIPEGDYYEFFGWMAPGLKKYSFSKTFLSSLFGSSEYRLDTNMHGGYRAFVMTGQYEKVVPMDIYPMQLLKAILAQDIDNMENLGIYEIAEEDLALCEFICSSKIEIQSIVRQGLDLMVKEMN